MLGQALEHAVKSYFLHSGMPEQKLMCQSDHARTFESHELTTSEYVWYAIVTGEPGLPETVRQRKFAKMSLTNWGLDDGDLHA